MNIEFYVHNRLKETCDRVQGALRTSYEPDEARIIIARYTATFAVNFTDWIGKTHMWTRHERARYALMDNQRCEQTEDHVGMLLSFTSASGVLVQPADYQYVAEGIARIRKGFTDTKNAGLYGTAVLACLEVTSRHFIPALEDMGRVLGLKGEDLGYTRSHGHADVKHADALTEALIAESQEHDSPIRAIDNGICYALYLLENIFTLE